MSRRRRMMAMRMKMVRMARTETTQRATAKLRCLMLHCRLLHCSVGCGCEAVARSADCRSSRHCWRRPGGQQTALS